VCGIAGIFSRSGHPVDGNTVSSLNRLLKHRGPDDEGIFFSPHRDAALAHRRLSIIDLETGRQPILNEDESLALVCNGEIYNFKSLRKELEQKGHQFRTKTDVEVILHLYEERDEACVETLRGMFAFALYDCRRERLFLARDRAGQKPLYYAATDRLFAFASEFSALAQGLPLNREIDPLALDSFLTFGYTGAPRTIFRSVRKLPPACTAVIEKKDPFRIEKYWKPRFVPKLRIDFEEAREELLKRITEASEMQTVADVPIGCFLSGGTDSSLVAFQLAGKTPRPIHTFTVGFREKDFDEREYAARVASAIGSEHHVIEIEPQPVEVIQDIVRGYGEPFGDSSALPTWLLSREARKVVKVALNGDGGDELFAGYPKYPICLRMNAVRRVCPGSVFSMLAHLARSSTRLRKGRRLLELLSVSGLERYRELSSTFSRKLKDELYTESFQGTLRNELQGESERLEDEGLEFLDSMLLADTTHYLPEDLLTKIDIATMANSLEGRSPFLDHALMEFAFRLPTEYKLRGNTTKYILKKALEKYLPNEFIYRKKMGFGLPIRYWFRGNLSGFIETRILTGLRMFRDVLRPQVVDRLLREHASGIDHQHRLWNLLVLALWAEDYL
jgi:asparagine synthase (glutamine-hydrolysing)